MTGTLPLSVARKIPQKVLGKLTASAGTSAVASPVFAETILLVSIDKRWKRKNASITLPQVILGAGRKAGSGI